MRGPPIMCVGLLSCCLPRRCRRVSRRFVLLSAERLECDLECVNLLIERWWTMKRISAAFVMASILFLVLAIQAEETGQSTQLAELEEQLAENPDDTDLLLAVGKLHLDSANYRKAREMFERAIAVDSTNARAFAWLGLTASSELREGYDEKIEKDANYRTNLIFATLDPLTKAVELAPEDLEIRMMRGIASVEMPVFGGFWSRFRGDMTQTITDEMIKKGYGGYLDYAVEDLHAVIIGDAPEDMKAEAYYYLGLAYRNRGLQYWQTLTRTYAGADASKRAWSAMKPQENWIGSAEIPGERVVVRFHIGFETDLPQQTGVWIEDRDGTYVKTLYISPFSAYVRYAQVVLPKWVDAAGFKIDSVTRASIPAGRYATTWDLTDTEGKRASNGQYVVKIEAHHWPSRHYQIVSAQIEVGGSQKTTVVEEGDLVPFVEIRYVPE